MWLLWALQTIFLIYAHTMKLMPKRFRNILETEYFGLSVTVIFHGMQEYNRKEEGLPTVKNRECKNITVK